VALANEPSVGLCYIQQHVQQSTPTVLTLEVLYLNPPVQYFPAASLGFPVLPCTVLCYSSLLLLTTVSVLLVAPACAARAS